MNNIVVIEATGSGVKRYINICHHHNICIKNIQFIDDMFSFEMKAKDYMKSKAFIKITGIKTIPPIILRAQVNVNGST